MERNKGVDRSQASKWRPLPHDPVLPWIPLSVADMDIPCSPAIVEAVVERARQGFYTYTDLPDDHTEIVVARLRELHGWDLPGEHVLSAQRIVQMVALALRSFTEPGDGVLLFTPSYGPLERAIELNHRRAVRIPLVLRGGGYELDRGAVADALPHVTAALLVNPHNPVGKVWTRDELTWLAAGFCEHDVLVLSDDVHAEFVRAGHRHHFLAQLDDGIAARSITFTSPAKSFNIPGLETTHAIIPDGELRRRMRHELLAAGFHNPSYFSHVATRAAYQSSDGWLAEVSAVVESNLARLRTTVAGLDNHALIEPEGTFLAWIDARPSSEEALQRLWGAGAHLAPSYGTDFGAEYVGFLRINLATPVEVFAEAMTRLSAA